MRKRKNNLRRVVRGGVMALALLSFVLPGCKKKPAPSAPVQVSPLPKKPVMGALSASQNAAAKPAGSPVPTATPATQAKTQPAPPGTPVTAQTKTAVSDAKPAAGKPEVQKQVSSARISPPPAGISLDFSNRRDPFRPYVQAPTAQKPGRGISAKPARDLLPIQSFDTERFKVSGIIAGIRENSALVIDPNGKGYVVKEGMLIGSNDGRIKKITASTVEVEESYRDDNGKVRKRLVKLALTRKK